MNVPNFGSKEFYINN